MTTPTGAPPPGTPASTPDAAGKGSPLGRLSPVVLILITVVGVLVLSALVFLLGRMTAGTSQAVVLESPVVTEEPIEVVTPVDDAPAPTVETIPDEPVVEEFPDEPIVEDPVVEEIPDEPVIDPAADPAASGQVVEIGAGITAAVPPGWEATAEEGSVAIGNADGGALLRLYEVPVGTTGPQLLSYYLQEVLSTEMTDLEMTTPEPLAIDVASITSAGVAVYRGTYVSQQGSTPLEGILYGFVRGDGTALVVDGYWAPGTDLVEEIDAITISAINTM